MSEKHVYQVTVNGTDHFVEAVSPAKARVIALRGTTVKRLTAGQALDLYRAGTTILDGSESVASDDSAEAA